MYSYQESYSFTNINGEKKINYNYSGKILNPFKTNW